MTTTLTIDAKTPLFRGDVLIAPFSRERFEVLEVAATELQVRRLSSTGAASFPMPRTVFRGLWLVERKQKGRAET